MILQRDITKTLVSNLDNEEVLLLIGPRQVGKTTALHQVESFLKGRLETTFFLNLEDPDYLELLNQTPKNIFQIFPINLSKKVYLFIDEVQYLKNPSNFLKYLFDEYKGKIKLLASGSSAFYLDQKFKDSLSGRKKLYTIYSLNFKEFLRFKNIQGLAKRDFNKLTISEKDEIKILFSEYMIWGGYPKVVLTNDTQTKVEILRELVYSYIKKDIFEANIRQDEEFYKLLKILSHQVGNLVNSNELSQTLGISKTAIDNYLSVMQKSFHIRLINPFFKNIRKELTKMPKVFFTDLGIRNFLKNDFRGIFDRDDKGQVLENTVFRQLIDKYDIDQIKFWRTTDLKEIDFVIDNNNLAYEVKFNLKNVKTNIIETFRENYPDIKVKYISLLGDFDSKHKNLYVWQI